MAQTRGGKNRRAHEHRSQEMLNSCRKFEGNYDMEGPLWEQKLMVVRHLSGIGLQEYNFWCDLRCSVG
jgi:hypothetical protein